MGEAHLPRRHDMVHVDPHAWAGIIAGHRDETPLLAGWSARGWPLVHRRSAANDAPGHMPLGLPLPPSLGKRRLSFTVPMTAIQSVTPPPLLREAATAAPSAWCDTVTKLAALSPEARIFGSLAWQHLTGLPYLSETSDLDVLWPLPADSRPLLQAIAAIAADAPMRIDGEFLRPDGSGAHWRELAASPEILVKHQNGAAMMARHAFLASAP